MEFFMWTNEHGSEVSLTIELRSSCFQSLSHIFHRKSRCYLPFDVWGTNQWWGTIISAISPSNPPGHQCFVDEIAPQTSSNTPSSSFTSMHFPFQNLVGIRCLIICSFCCYERHGTPELLFLSSGFSLKGIVRTHVIEVPSWNDVWRLIFQMEPELCVGSSFHVGGLILTRASVEGEPRMAHL